MLADEASVKSFITKGWSKFTVLNQKNEFQKNQRSKTEQKAKTQNKVMNGKQVIHRNLLTDMEKGLLCTAKFYADSQFVYTNFQVISTLEQFYSISLP